MLHVKLSSMGSDASETRVVIVFVVGIVLYEKCIHGNILK